MKLWSLQLWTQFLQLSKEAWKIQDFNGVWTRDLAIPVRGHGFKPRWSPEFFRLLYAIAKIAFITATIIASLDFISAVHIWFISYIISSLDKIVETFCNTLPSHNVVLPNGLRNSRANNNVREEWAAKLSVLYIPVLFQGILWQWETLEFLFTAAVCCLLLSVHPT